jgi:hypothetical protein|tara:strand:- start:3044 stop:3250 length:207 start_codon:yes stop_codon:yes gene_type:complete
MEVTVIYRGSELELEGEYIQAYSGGREEESIQDYFETCCVYAGGVEITELFNDDQLVELDALAIEELY